MTSLEPALGVVDFMDDNDEKKMRKKRKLQQKGSKKQKKQKTAHPKQTEENGDESDQDVGQNKQENKPKEKTEAPKREAGESFASAIQAILNKRADVEEPVIAKSKEIVQLKKETKEKEKHDKISQKQKQLLLNKDHKIPDFTNAEHESKLRKIATRGVVKLFNAVNKQQKLIGTEEPSHRNYEKMSKLSKEKFLELLKTSNKKEITAEQAQDIVTRKTKSPVLANNSQGAATKKDAASAKQKPAAKKTDDSIPKERDEGPKWGALRDDFMLGAKMKDWNKTIEEEVQYDNADEADDEGSGSD